MRRDELHKLLHGLVKKSLSIYDYQKKIEDGSMVKFKHGDDYNFERNHPEHPLAASNRMQRIGAADKVRDIAASEPSKFTHKHLEMLHKAAFDCCSAVRLSIIQAIGLISNRDSMDVLNQVLNTDPSREIRAAAAEAIKVINGELKINEGYIIRSEQVYEVSGWYIDLLLDGKISTKRQHPIELLDDIIRDEGWRRLPHYAQPIVNEAIAKWEEIERGILSRMQMDKGQFLAKFNEARASFLNKDMNWLNFILPVFNVVYGAVRNMYWVDLFSIVLPEIDPEHSDRYKTIGRMMTAFLYIEFLYKDGLNSDENNMSYSYYLEKLETKWSLVN